MLKFRKVKLFSTQLVLLSCWKTFLSFVIADVSFVLVGAVAEIEVRVIGFGDEEVAMTLNRSA